MWGLARTGHRECRGWGSTQQPLRAARVTHTYIHGQTTVSLLSQRGDICIMQMSDYAHGIDKDLDYRKPANVLAGHVSERPGGLAWHWWGA